MNPTNALEVNIKNNFVVSDFMEKLDIDYIFSYNQEENVYKLLNNDMYGTFHEEDIQGFLKSNKTVIIHDKLLKLYAYNIEELDLLEALMNM